ncbi:MAG: hypothetical protein K6D91_05910 [Prevotella sp.]|jgi:hypothetical protein|nr:hypothetical protein [Prevotella sp.]
MTDKVQKIREEIEKLHKEYRGKKGAFYYRKALRTVLFLIDTLQKEPASEQNLSNVERTGKNWKEPVSEDLEEVIIKRWKILNGSGNSTPFDTFNGIACYFATWQKEQFKNNRLKHCNSITKEQAELEQGFIDQHLDKHQRMPTFLDAIEYGMRLREQQMMAKAIDGEVGYWNLRGLSVNVELPRSVKEGDKVKVIVIKEG